MRVLALSRVKSGCYFGYFIVDKYSGCLQVSLANGLCLDLKVALCVVFSQIAIRDTDTPPSF